MSVLGTRLYYLLPNIHTKNPLQLKIRPVLSGHGADFYRSMDRWFANCCCEQQGKLAQPIVVPVLRWFKNWRNTLFWQFLTEPPCCSNVKISRRCRNSFPVERAGDAPLRRVRLKLCAFFPSQRPTALVLQLIKSPWILTIPLDKIQSSWTTYINFLTCT